MADDMFEVPGDRLRELSDYAKVARTIAVALAEVAQNAHTHTWDILGIKVPVRPFHPRMPDNNTTTVLLRCRVCGWPETSELNGIWTEYQFRKAIGESDE